MDSDIIKVPASYPTATVYIDESGSRASGSRFFVMGGVKTRSPGRLGRRLKEVRDRTGFSKEFKFSEITSSSLVPYYEAIKVLEDSDVHIIASVVNRDQHDPFRGASDHEVHVEVASRLLIGAINKRELIGAVLDLISTPPDVAIDELVRKQVNRHFRNASVVTAICADSRSMDTLQMADLVASAIAHERRRAFGESGKTNAHPSSPKAKVAARLLTAFGLASSEDQRTDRANIATIANTSGPRTGRATGTRPELVPVERSA